MKNLTYILIIIIITLLGTPNILQTKPISKKQAIKVAKNFYQQRAKKRLPRYHLYEEYEQENKKKPLLYIVSIKRGGFIIVSGNDALYPVLAYSFENSLSPKKEPKQFNYVLSMYKKRIISAYEENIPSTDYIQSQWKKYL